MPTGVSFSNVYRGGAITPNEVNAEPVVIAWGAREQQAYVSEPKELTREQLKERADKNKKKHGG